MKLPLNLVSSCSGVVCIPSKGKVIISDWKEYLPDKKEFIQTMYQKLDKKTFPKIQG